MARTLRIATFNLENLDDVPGQDPSLATRIAVLRPQLLRLNADLLCLQEVNGQRTGAHEPRRLMALDALLEDTPYAEFYRVGTVGPDGIGVLDVHNLVTLSRYPIIESAQYRHELVPAPAYRPVTAQPLAPAEVPVEWDRPILHSAVTLEGGRRLEIINLHLRAPLAAFLPGQKEAAFAWKTVSGWAEGFFLSAIKRSGQALEVRMLVDQLFDRDPEALIVVCGDFNAEEREMPVRIVRGDEDDTGSGRLAMRVMVPADHSLPAARRYSVRHAGYQAMLDHLLASKPLMTWYRGIEVHNETLGDELVGYASLGRSPESYHAPLVVEFDIPESA